MFGKPECLANSRERPRKTCAVFANWLAPRFPRGDREARPAERPGRVDDVAGPRAIAAERQRRRAEHSDGERKVGAARQVAARNGRVERARGFTYAFGDLSDEFAPVRRDTHCDEHRDRGRRHCREIAQRRGCGSVANFRRCKPRSAKVDVLDGCVRARHEATPGRHVEYRSVIADASCRGSPSPNQVANDVELAPWAKRDAVAHNVRSAACTRPRSSMAGSSATTGGRGGGADSLQAFGSMSTTSSMIGPRGPRAPASSPARP